MAKKFIEDIEITESVLDKINMYSVKPLTAEEVCCFSVLLCDNEIDRDYECFSAQSIEKLAKLYIGRKGILSRDINEENQTARIYNTEVKSYHDRKTTSGENYTVLIGYAYMVKTEDNKSFFAEIDDCIKKEASISCSVGTRICSVCGADMSKNPCSHIRGMYYDNKLCFVTLANPTDAYEWAFWAVPTLIPNVNKKFIDAEMLKEEIEHNWDMQDLYLPIHFFDKVDEMPAADVREVKHGHWERYNDKTKVCSRCNHGALNHMAMIYNYCPNCGSRMDGEEK